MKRSGFEGGFMPRRSAAALAGALAIFLLACLPAAGSAAEKGLNVDLTWGVSHASQERTIEAIKDSGAEWVRIEIDWHWLTEPELTPGWEWEPARVQELFDRAVRLSNDAGIKVLVMVQRSPMSVSGSTIHEAPPIDPQDFASFMTATAARYRGTVEAYELWNEPNFKRFWPEGPDAAEYVELLKAGSIAVRAVDPDAEIVFGGTQWNDYRFLEAAYAAEPDLGDYFDVMGVHPYTPLATPAPEAIRTAPDGRMTKDSFPAYREVREVLLAHGDVKPIWFTEFGWATSSEYQSDNPVDEAEQADYLKRAYEYIERDPYVEVAFWYNLRNNWDQQDADTWEGQMGLLLTDHSPKLSYEAFKGVGVAVPHDPPLSLRVAQLNTGAGERTDVVARGEVRDPSVARSQVPRSVRIVVERRRHGAWKNVKRFDRPVMLSGRYGVHFKLRSDARWRVTAVHRARGETVKRRTTFST